MAGSEGLIGDFAGFLREGTWLRGGYLSSDFMWSKKSLKSRICVVKMSMGKGGEMSRSVLCKVGSMFCACPPSWGRATFGSAEKW